MSKRLLLIIICFSLISVVLLSSSNAEQSGNDIKSSLIESNDNGIKVVYSSNLVNNEDIINLSVRNKVNNVRDYIIKLDKDVSNVMVSIDGSEYDYVTDYIYKGTLSALGDEGDLVLHSLSFKYDGTDSIKVIVEEYNGEVYGS